MKSRELALGPLIIRFNLIVAVCVFLAAAGFVRLGIWQLSRAQEKIAEQNEFMASGQDTASDITSLPLAGLAFDRIQHQNRRVVMNGRYLNDKSIFLIYQSHEAQLGFEVLTPFRVEGLDLLVLVSRGWNASGQVDELVATLPAITGEQIVEGQLFVPDEDMAGKHNDSQNTDFPLVRRYVNISELTPLFDSPLFPYVVRLSEGQNGVLVRHWPQVVVATGRHFSYALQWFAMAIAVLTVALILSSNILVLFRRKS